MIASTRLLGHRNVVILLSDYEKCINVPFSETVLHEKDFEVRVRQTSDQELVKVIIRIDTKRLTYVSNTTRC